MARNTALAASTTSPTPVCPLCGKPLNRAFRPFCSRTCADIDLGRWLGGSYVIAAENPDDDADEDRA